MPAVREAKIDDARAINELSRHLGYKPLTDNVLTDNLEAILTSKSDKLWIFEKENQILGWIHAFSANRVASAAFIEIGGMVVSPDARREGIGRRLVEQAKQWACERKQNLRVRCNIKREETHKFYESVGFVLSKSQNIFEILS